MAPAPKRTAYRAALLHLLDDPARVGVAGCHQFFADGLLVVEDGLIAAVGPAAVLLPQLPQGTPVQHYPDSLILPGFIDCHLHFPQIDMLASGGNQLLDWLERYTWPAEQAMAEPAVAQSAARRCIAELLRNGVTSAMVFASVHLHAAEAFFSEAHRLNLRMICGKVLMDRHAPADLLDNPERGKRQSNILIERWHGKGRLHYAVTPRFAGTSSREQLETAGQLLREHEGLYLQTHLAENLSEVDWVTGLFPEAEDYLHIYEQHGLVGPRSVFAHGIHLCDNQCQRLGEQGAAIAFCPTSNLFLGSGLFDLARAERHGIRVGLASDVGAGTSFSPFVSLNEAYKVLQLQGQSLDPWRALYMATLGAARALYLEDRIGNLQPDSDADFVVLDLKASPLLEQRLAHSRGLDDWLLALLMLADDRCVERTFAAGRLVHQRD